MNRPALTKEEAVEVLAKRLNWAQEKLDPSGEGDWDGYDERERDFYRSCISFLLTEKVALRTALGLDPTATSKIGMS